MCIDRTAPPKRTDERLALLRASLWQSGDIIKATFLDGEPAIQKSVRAAALNWTSYANLNLYFVSSRDEADIRISFQEPGSWSYIGTDCRRISVTRPTMNFGWLTPNSAADEISRVVLHEFGHALGCIHEHQNPAGGIKWNTEAVYEYYAGPPNFWLKEDVDRNVLELYDEDFTVHSRLDPASIMMYPIDPRLTLDGFGAGLNAELSQTDKDFIAVTYP